MFLLIELGFLALAILSLRGVRWAYVSYVVLGLLFFPASVGFRLQPQACELTLTVPLAIHSLTNYAHIWRFALFYAMTTAQLRLANWSAFAWAALATLTMGALVEIAEGISGRGHCRLRDLVPDTAGALIGAAIVLLWRRVRRRWPF
jgi:VanZ family protein